MDENNGGLGGLWGFGAPSGSSVARRFLEDFPEAAAVAAAETIGL